MSSPSTELQPSQPPAEPQPQTKVPNPWKNPSYPQRVHSQEKPQWQSILKHWDQKIAEARKKLNVMGSRSDRPTYERMFGQMLGARDQIAEAVKRLPGEVGYLYEEDRELLERGVAALERIFQRWH